MQRIGLKGHFGFGMLRHIYDTDQYWRCSFAQKVQAVIEESNNFLFGGMGSGQRRHVCLCLCLSL